MRHAASLILITCMFGLGVLFAVEVGTQLVATPAITAVLLILGMALMISQMTFSEKWRMSGVGGVLCLSMVMASHAISQNTSWTGFIILLLGIGLLLVEAHLYPGHGISAIGGAGSIFIGLYLTLSATMDVMYALAVSAVVTLLAFAAFLAYLPKNQVWRNMGRRLDISVGRSHVETVHHTKTGKATVRKISSPQQQAEEFTTDTSKQTEARERRSNETLPGIREELRRSSAEEAQNQQIVGDGKSDL